MTDVMNEKKDRTEEIRVEPTSCGRFPLGLFAIPGGFHVSVSSAGKKCALILYKRNTEEVYKTLAFPEEGRVGDVWSMNVEIGDVENLEYAFSNEDGIFPDPCARTYSGRDSWGKPEQYKNERRSLVAGDSFDWQGDRPLRIPYEESIIYRLNVRAFTESPSSRVTQRGTFDAVTEKIPYFKELGITAVELMPCQEYDEIMMPPDMGSNPFHDDLPTGKINLWGYTKAYRFAPKASFCRKKDRNPAREFKTMVRELHRAGIEVIPEIYFDGTEAVSYVLDVLRFWVCAYHVDGIHLVGNAPSEQIAGDPYLTETKLFAGNWDNSLSGRVKHLASYNDAFLQDMRRFLKGDEGMVSSLLFHTKNNPANAAVINYMANTNGFTMMDMVSYDIKHNEGNGENNADGTDFNYSWNCGVEGPTKKKKILELRMKQLRNAFLLLFLSQGTPLLLSGDEFGRTKGGNNNSYCQDNEVSWLNWKLLHTNRALFAFVKHAIAFRKAHPVFHYPQEPKVLDTLALGLPDVSYHGVNAWQPEFENWRRQLGILYCGDYAKQENGDRDRSFYVLYNMHWEPHEFALPNPEKGDAWFVAMDTADEEHNGFYPAGEERYLTEQKKYMMPERCIVVLVSGKNPIPVTADPRDRKKKTEKI
jgi:isoamylase